jgi:hypothetical protein
MLQIRDGMMKVGMYRSKWIVAAAPTVLALVSMPTICQATSATADDPGAFAVLGTIYFSSVLGDAGIGSGHSGKSSTAGGVSSGSTRNLPNGSNMGNAATMRGGSDDFSTPGPGGIGPGNSSEGSDPYTPTFGNETPGDKPDAPVGGMHGGGGDEHVNLPGADSSIDPDEPNTESPDGPIDVGGYEPDEILSGQGPLVLPKVTPVVSSAEIVQVPEPATLLLFGAGLAGLGLLARRRKA